MTTPFGQTLQGSIFDEDPQLAFLTYLLRQNVSQPQQRFFQSQFGDVNNLFRQQLGGQLAQGQVPNQSFFNDFLPNFNLNQYRLGFSPQDRGEGARGFNPRTRFLQ